MTEELQTAVSSAIDFSQKVISNNDVNNFDGVISCLERVITAIDLESQVNELNWAQIMINRFESIIKNIEDKQAEEKQKGEKRLMGRPRLEIPMDKILRFIELKMSATKIAKMYGISYKTLRRRLKEIGVRVTDYYTTVTDENLEEVIYEILENHPNTGYKRMVGFLACFKSEKYPQGIRVTTERCRLTLRNVDPIGTENRRKRNRAIRRRIYYVAHSMDVWHVDSHLKMVRYKFVFHAGIDGNSRLCPYLKITSDNRAATGLKCFIDGVRRYGVPVKFRSDHGGENHLVARFMLTLSGPDSKAVITGRSVYNQRIERYWGDLGKLRVSFDQILNELEENGTLDIGNENHLYILHYVYLPIFQLRLDEFRDGWNHHPLTTENYRPPILLFEQYKDEKRKEIDRDRVEMAYHTSLAYHTEVDNEEEDDIRYPSIHHNLTPEQIQLLNTVNPLDEDGTHGVAIFQRCLQLLFQ